MHSGFLFLLLCLLLFVPLRRESIFINEKLCVAKIITKRVHHSWRSRDDNLSRDGKSWELLHSNSVRRFMLRIQFVVVFFFLGTHRFDMTEDAKRKFPKAEEFYSRSTVNLSWNVSTLIDFDRKKFPKFMWILSLYKRLMLWKASSIDRVYPHSCQLTHNLLLPAHPSHRLM